MINFAEDYKRAEDIILEIDKTMLTKTSKIQFEEYQKFVLKTFVLTQNQTEFTNKVNQELQEQSHEIKKKHQDIQESKALMENRLESELRKMMHKIQGSVLEREAMNGNYLATQESNDMSSEIKNMLSQKTNKNDHEMVIR